MSEDVKTIAKFLYCLSVLEEKVAYAYKSLAERVEDPLLSSLLLYNSTDGMKHFIILKAIDEELVRNLGVKAEVKDCENTLGEIWRKLIMLAEEETAKKEKVGNSELVSLANKMIAFESFFGEEYLTNLHLKIVSLMADELKVDLGDLKGILDWIVEDEERHEKIIAIIKDTVLKRKGGES